jgi:hypothetical protein
MNAVAHVDMEKVRQNVSRNILSTKKIASSIRAEDARDKIDPEAIINRLIDLLDEADTTPPECIGRLNVKVQVLTVLLKKSMPDLRALEITDNKTKFSRLIIDVPTLQQPEGSE